MTAQTILPANSAASGGFDVANSVRMNRGSTDHLRRTNNTGETSNKIGTYSGWLKRSTVALDGMMFEGKDLDANNYTQIYFQATGKLTVYGSGTMDIVSTALFRDPTAWYHVCVAIDTTQGTAANRVKIYVNGVQVTSLTNGNGDGVEYPDQNDVIYFAVNGDQQAIGIREDGALLWNGYFSEVVYIDGTQLTPTSFGEFDEDSGIWKPIKVSGLTFGNNGCYLDFKDSSALGNVVAGRTAVDFTVTNLTAVDQSTDTCTNNFATLNPLNSTLTNTVLSEGNLKLVGGRQSAQYTYITGTIAVSSGKWYWEVKAVDNSEIDQVGVAKMDLAQFATISTSTGLQGAAYGGRGVQMSNGNKVGDGSQGAHMGGFSANNICMIALDLDNNKITFGRNGSWSNGSGGADQTFANATAAYTDLTAGAMYVPAQTMRDSGNNNPGTMEYNFGNAPYAISSGNSDGNGHGNFEYAVPSGYFALNTKNLAEHG